MVTRVNLLQCNAVVLVMALWRHNVVSATATANNGFSNHFSNYELFWKFPRDISTLTIGNSNRALQCPKETSTLKFVGYCSIDYSISLCTTWSVYSIFDRLRFRIKLENSNFNWISQNKFTSAHSKNRGKPAWNKSTKILPDEPIKPLPAFQEPGHQESKRNLKFYAVKLTIPPNISLNHNRNEVQ